jgi:hypothetical protein
MFDANRVAHNLDVTLNSLFLSAVISGLRSDRQSAIGNRNYVMTDSSTKLFRRRLQVLRRDTRSQSREPEPWPGHNESCRSEWRGEIHAHEFDDRPAPAHALVGFTVLVRRPINPNSSSAKLDTALSSIPSLAD